MILGSVILGSILGSASCSNIKISSQDYWVNNTSTIKPIIQGGYTMNYSQNDKINQITTDTMVVGVDIAKFTHVARAVDYRGIEISRKISFKNNRESFLVFERWMDEIKTRMHKTKVMIGMEPTGQYWENLANYLLKKGYKVVVVNPMHVNRSKELEDNNQTKTDSKDAMLIASLVKDGRFFNPNILEGIYADLREAMDVRDRNLKNLQQTKNRIHRWFDRYFPEFYQVFKGCFSMTLLHLIKENGLPAEIAEQNPDEIYENLPRNLRIACGRAKIDKLCEVCKNSVGIKNRGFAKVEFENLLRTYDFFQTQISILEEHLEKISADIVEIQRIMKMKGMGLISACGIVSELGDIRGYMDPRQLYKMAGLSLRENSSGERKGKTRITKRGRSDLRRILYQIVFSLIKNNKAFKEMHHYFKNRAKNQLSAKASIIALCRKLLRILFAIIHKDIEYDEEKMMKDIKYPKEFLVHAA